MKLTSKVLILIAGAVNAQSIFAKIITPEQAIQWFPNAGGYWVTPAEATEQGNEYRLKYKYSPVERVKIEMDPRCLNNPKNESCVGHYWTPAIAYKTVTGEVRYAPSSFQQVGLDIYDNDFILIGGYISEVITHGIGGNLTDPYEPAYASCVTSPSKIRWTSLISSVATSSYSKATSYETSVGDTEGTKLGLDFGVETKGGLGDLLNTNISLKVSTTYEWSRTHVNSTGGSSENTWTDSDIYTNSTLFETQVPPGYFGSSAYRLPSIEIRGLFKFGRLLMKNPGAERYFNKLQRRKLSDGELYYKVLDEPTAMAKPSGWWLGKLVVPVTYIAKTSATLKPAQHTVVLKNDAMTVAEYRDICRADIAARTYAPNQKAALCRLGIDKSRTCQ